MVNHLPELQIIGTFTLIISSIWAMLRLAFKFVNKYSSSIQADKNLILLSIYRKFRGNKMSIKRCKVNLIIVCLVTSFMAGKSQKAEAYYVDFISMVPAFVNICLTLSTISALGGVATYMYAPNARNYVNQQLLHLRQTVTASVTASLNQAQPQVVNMGTEALVGGMVMVNDVLRNSAGDERVANGAAEVLRNVARLPGNIGRDPEFQAGLRDLRDAMWGEAYHMMRDGARFYAIGTAITVGIGLASWATYETVKTVITHKLEQYGKPKLVEDLANKSIFSSLGFGKYKGPKWSQLILNQKLQDDLDRFHKMLEASNGKKNKFPLPSLLLYGPPGTGKTEIARRLAKELNWNFAILPASSFSQFPKEEGLKQMNDLFAWAESSRTKTVIFVDEAEVLFGDRENGDKSETAHEFLTNWLAHTGKLSNNYTIFYATNRPNAFDKAMNRRITYQLEVGLPGPEERLELSKFYLGKLEVKHPDVVLVCDRDKIHEYAARTLEGLSGSYYEEAMLRLFLEARVSGGIIDRDLYSRVFQDVKEKSKDKNSYLVDEISA